MIKEDSTHSLDPSSMEEETTQRKSDKEEDINILWKQMKKIEWKFTRLTHFIIKIIHRSIITLSKVIKEYVDKKINGDCPNWIRDDVLNLLT